MSEILVEDLVSKISILEGKFGEHTTYEILDPFLLNPNDIVEIQAYPESNDVVGLKDLYVSFDISKSQINMVKDTIASGEDISGVVFTKNSYRSSYSNGSLTRS